MKTLPVVAAILCLSAVASAKPAPRSARPVSIASVQKRWTKFFNKEMGQMEIPKSMNVSAQKLPGAAKSTFFRVQKTYDGVIMGAYHDKRTKTFVVADCTYGEGDARFRVFNNQGKLVARAAQTDDGFLNW